MAWEFAEVQPGQALANLKKGGLRELLEQLAGVGEGETAGAGGEAKPAPAVEAEPAPAAEAKPAAGAEAKKD
jgi:hypothetical protein